MDVFRKQASKLCEKVAKQQLVSVVKCGWIQVDGKTVPSSYVVRPSQKLTHYVHRHKLLVMSLDITVLHKEPDVLTICKLTTVPDSSKGVETAKTSSMSGNDTFTQGKANESVEEAAHDENQSNIVTSLAEKAMSVAGPVVPTNESGQADQER